MLEEEMEYLPPWDDYHIYLGHLGLGGGSDAEWQTAGLGCSPAQEAWLLRAFDELATDEATLWSLKDRHDGPNATLDGESMDAETLLTIETRLSGRRTGLAGIAYMLGPAMKDELDRRYVEISSIFATS